MQQIWTMSQPTSQQEARRGRQARTRDLLTPLFTVATGVVLAIAVVALESARVLAYPLGLVGGIAILPWIVTVIPVSARYRASDQGFRSLVMSVAVFVSLSGLYSGRFWPFVAGLGLLGVGIALWIVDRRLER